MLSQASSCKGTAFVTQNEWEYRNKAFEKGHVRSSAKFPGSQGNSLCHFKYWLFRLGLPWEQHAAIMVKPNAQRREALAFVCLDLKQMLALQPVDYNCFVTGDASVHAGDV